MWSPQSPPQCTGKYKRLLPPPTAGWSQSVNALPLQFPHIPMFSLHLKVKCGKNWLVVHLSGYQDVSRIIGPLTFDLVHDLPVKAAHFPSSGQHIWVSHYCSGGGGACKPTSLFFCVDLLWDALRAISCQMKAHYLLARGEQVQLFKDRKDFCKPICWLSCCARVPL